MFEYRPFPEVKKNFGFGCMRLPMVDDKVDNAEFCKMVDAFLENGFNYFDLLACSGFFYHHHTT